MDLSILKILTNPFWILGVSGVIYHFYLILDRKSFKQTVDPDQTLRSAASDLGLDCLSMSQKRDTRLSSFCEGKILSLGHQKE